MAGAASALPRSSSCCVRIRMREDKKSIQNFRWNISEKENSWNTYRSTCASARSCVYGDNIKIGIPEMRSEEALN